MDHGVQLTDGGDRDTDVELLARRDHRHALGHVAVRGGDRPRTASIVKIGASVRAQVVEVEVVRVLVGDQHGGRTVDGLPLGEAARVHDNDLAVVLDGTQACPNLVTLMAPNLVREPELIRRGQPMRLSTKHQRQSSPGSAERITG